MSTVGVDVGGTATKAVLTSDDGAVLRVRTVPTPRPGPDIAQQVVDLSAGLVRHLGGDQAGVVVPGIVDDRAGVGLFSENLGWRNVPFERLLNQALGMPVGFGHDVRAGALAESRLGAGRNARSMVFMPVGTGIAAAAVIDGQVLDVGGWAGEIGHVRVGHDEPCVCGGQGCLEAIASAAAIQRRYHRRSGHAVTGAAEVAALVRAGDPDAVAVWDEAVEALATALAWAAAFFAPEVVVIGGGLGQAGELLLMPLALRGHRVAAAELGALAGCRGAALIAGGVACR